MGRSASSAAPGAAAATAFTILSQLCGAAFLYALLKADGGWQVIGLLVLLGVGFFLLERFPWINDFVMASLTRVPLITTATAAVIVLGFPFLVGSNTYILHLLIVAQLYAVLALALNFQLGSANIPNFSTGASYGIGAYASALLALNFGMSFWLTLPIAALAATLFGFIIGIPSMRTRDTYLALVTIAFGVVVQQLLNNFDWTGGPNGLVGIPAPSLFGHSFASPLQVFGWKLPSQANFYYLSAALVVVAIVTAQRLHGSRIGLAWNALRADEIAAKAQGINVAWYKVLAFAVDAFLAAFAGTIYAFYVSYISPDNFTFLVSVTIMTMVIVGGMDNIFGVIIGAFLLTILPEKLRAFSDYRLLFFGVVVIGFLMIRPQGLFPQRLRQYGVHR
ncbi:branched-chain amino acid ABC transporter permease [Phyllobacterium phragmitis]|uniref:Branched-chain amino acid ABC transporter permease n=1 Tax=Phyllobacterium phragmitis TaxID=2670329 RepID=A0A2S9IXW5_9HYPH|nr:branched-chain amino acid ABC transporter permease [Phyllobacterium phragmitis]PRD45369.1 branched-chain amino acid ABC transporter permease [Phyllobacterium phragmitis]